MLLMLPDFGLCSIAMGFSVGVAMGFSDLLSTEAYMSNTSCLTSNTSYLTSNTSCLTSNTSCLTTALRLTFVPWGRGLQ